MMRLLSDMNWCNGIPRLVVVNERCPLCHATEFQISMSHPLTNFFSAFWLHRVRCMNCWRRYYWFTNRIFNLH
jgi:hypothetical protein